MRPINLRDLSGVARVHLLAFPESALTLLGAEAVRRYYHWQLAGPHDAVAFCIGEGEEVTGFCFGGVFRGALRGYLEKNRGYLFACVVGRPWIVFNPIVRKQIATAIRSLNNRSSQSIRVTKVEISRPTFGVLAIAVHPAAAKKGQGQQLMQCLEDVARKRQFSGMHLTVSPDNLNAVGFYERLGWIRVPTENGSWKGFMKKTLSSQ